MTTLARAARRRLARGDTPTERVTLPDGRWIEVFMRHADRQPIDYALRNRELLAAIVAATNVTDANGTPIDPNSDEGWRAIAFDEQNAFLLGVSELVRAKRIERDV